jgi:hypothetical protein
LITLTTGATYTLSCYVKSTSGSNQTFRIYANAGAPFSPDFTATSSWQRVTLTFTAAAGNNSFGVTRDSSTNNYDILVYGIQMELGSTATTYQPILTTQQAYISNQFKYNLKDPRDLDAAFRLVFNGGWTHSSTGATPNGTNGYADTKLNPSLSGLSSTSTHISTYLRTNNDGVYCDMGAYDGNPANYQISTYARITNICYVDLGAQLQTRQTYANTDSSGYYVASRTANNVLKAFKNNILKATNTNTNTSSITALNKNIFISANNDAGGGVTQFSTRQQSFSTIGDGLSDTEASNLYSRVQQFQVSLSRNV